MDTFKIIYRILKHLEASMDFASIDIEAISAARLGISPERWEYILIMLQKNEYIEGIIFAQSMSEDRPRIVEPIYPMITLKGLGYLSDNTFMQRAAKTLEGIKDIIPGV